MSDLPVQPRRDFLKGILASAGALLGAVAVSAMPAAAENTPTNTTKGHRWGMTIDLDKCTGCASCVVACSQENNLPVGSPEEAAMGRIIQWLDILPMTEGEFPDPKQKLVPMPCQHCDDAPCTKVCPVYATFKNEEGIVGQVYTRCIGCRYCVNACPYTCKFFNWKAPEWPEEMTAGFNPDVSVRSVGVVEKCLFCHHRLQRAKDQAVGEGNRALSEQDYQTACQQVCPATAIHFGDLNNPDTDVAVLSKDSRAFHLLDDLGTKPKVTYLREGE